MSSVQAISKCEHNHFAYPFCKQLGTAKKVALVFFHILTLGIPLAIYHIISCCKPTWVSGGEIRSIQQEAIKSIKNPPEYPYSELGQAALDFARKVLLGKKPAAKKFDAVKQPVNPEIKRLYTYYCQAYHDFQSFLQDQYLNKPDLWDTQEVIDKTDELMKISFAICNLTLDDLKQYSKKHKRSYVDSLAMQDGFPCSTFYLLRQLYNLPRGGFYWKTIKIQKRDLLWCDGISKEFAEKFYTPGTKQNEWNRLFNEFCDRARKYVDAETLDKGDSRLFKYSIPDIREAEGKYTFERMS